MSDEMMGDQPDRIEPPSAALEALLAAERPLPAVPGLVHARIYTRLRASLGLPGGGGTGGGPSGAAASSAGLGGAGLGGLLAILLGAGTVSYLVLRAVLDARPATVVTIGAPADDAPAGAAAGVRAGAGQGSAGRPSGPPRFRTLGARSGGEGDKASASAAAAGTEDERKTDAGLPPEPGWYGQREVKKQPIAGQVRDRGRPAVGAEVVLEGLLSPVDPAFTHKLVTGADGRFDFGPQTPWFYAVTATSPGRRPATARLHVGDPVARPPADALVLELGNCEAGIVGTVSDESGQGIPDARVRALLVDAPENPFNGPAVETDQLGRFQLCGSPGKQRLRIDAEGYGSVRVNAVAAQAQPRTDVRLATEAVVLGRTIRRETGAPIPGVQLIFGVMASGPGSSSLAAVVTTISDPEGAFEVRGLAAGKYWVAANAADAMGREDSIVEVRAGEIKRGLVRRLDTTATVDVLVLARGKPVSGVVLNLGLIGSDDFSYGVISQPDGRATIHGVFPGQNQFLVRDDGHGRVPHRVVSPDSLNVVTPRVRGVVLTLEPTSTWEKP